MGDGMYGRKYSSDWEGACSGKQEQLSEYDCGPTTMLNAISFLFEREEISPVVIRNVMLYCLDSYNGEGIMEKAVRPVQLWF